MDVRQRYISSHLIPFLFFLLLASPLKTRNDAQAVTKKHTTHQVSQLQLTCKSEVKRT